MATQTKLTLVEQLIDVTENLVNCGNEIEWARDFAVDARRRNRPVSAEWNEQAQERASSRYQELLQRQSEIAREIQRRLQGTEAN